ncbi:nucleotidyltransferase domain-containing protein [Clostridium polynesiense]|uniref:nucleotidyltransferase domain-containing protein n=1 Tax=Clostridium polynesiense TaxID=1325933 RepID=UPI00058DCB00|nr:nucleotidyltransferase domain-containing protein [Clostridium polynesiense]
MHNIIVKYQKAYNTTIEELKKSKNILAAMVFGSMVSGDLWEESDIDLFVIKDDNCEEIKNIYTDYNGVPVHIKLLSKGHFIKLYESSIKGGMLHRLFSSSKLCFSKDADITNIYNRGRYVADLDRERWSIVYLGQLLKNLGVCKKYIYNEKIYTSYALAIKCIEDFANLYVNDSGYMISKDTISLAMNLNSEFRFHVDRIFFNSGKNPEDINNLILFIEENLKSLVKNTSSLILNFLKVKDKVLSAEDIKNDKLFQGYDINMEEILHELWENGYIKKQFRDYKTEDGCVILKENVYYI